MYICSFLRLFHVGFDMLYKIPHRTFSLTRLPKTHSTILSTVDFEDFFIFFFFYRYIYFIFIFLSVLRKVCGTNFGNYCIEIESVELI